MRIPDVSVYENNESFIPFHICADFHTRAFPSGMRRDSVQWEREASEDLEN